MPINDPNIYLCKLSEIMANQGKGFSMDTGHGTLHLFVVQRDGQIYGYINRCPHTGVNLDWTPDQFLDSTGKLIQCATHGAQFRIEDGLCIHGPCSGQSLTPVSISLHGGEVFLQVN